MQLSSCLTFLRLYLAIDNGLYPQTVSPDELLLSLCLKLTNTLRHGGGCGLIHGGQRLSGMSPYTADQEAETEQ